MRKPALKMNQGGAVNPLPVETLVVNYKFDDNLLDSTTNSNDGTNASDITYGAGVIDKNAIFNGSTSSFDILTSASLNDFFNDGVNEKLASISFMYSITSSSFTQRIISEYTDNTQLSVMTYSGLNELRITLRQENTGQAREIIYNISASLNTVYHVVITFNYEGPDALPSDSMSLYINGVHVADSTKAGGSFGTVAHTGSFTNYHIGKRSNNTGRFNGKLEALKFWKTALNSEQVAYLAAQELAGNSVT